MAVESIVSAGSDNVFFHISHLENFYHQSAREGISLKTPTLAVAVLCYLNIRCLSWDPSLELTAL